MKLVSSANMCQIKSSDFPPMFLTKVENGSWYSGYRSGVKSKKEILAGTSLADFQAGLRHGALGHHVII